ncbi:response regulator transcription factor [Actinoplanes sp. NPDC049118]|uniref:response regulator transcription factor n=1 Tax=Actinoplanes sp. NPDC049118 TaxID=3155769 RepID=UPI0033CDEE50
MRILVIDDNQDLNFRVTRGLRSIGFAVDGAFDLAEADFKLAVNTYDCLVLDRDLPDGDGAALIGGQGGGARPPALVLTARNAVADRVEGFAAGADDCLGKPFAMAELVARVRALCRRVGEIRPSVLHLGDLALDLSRRRVTRRGALLALSAKEFAVLELLALRAEHVVTRSELIERCWDEQAEPESNVVDAVMARLRRRLGPPPVIESVRGVGFRLTPVGGVTGG